MTKEKLAVQIMKECARDGEPVTKEEAEQMAEMEIKARGIRRYEKSETPRKSTKRERKVDVYKTAIMDQIIERLEPNADSKIERKSESECSFQYCGESYTIKLIKHRPPKDS